MRIISKLSMGLILIFMMLIQSSYAYQPPSREIIIKPYLNLLFPRNFFEFENGSPLVENETGVGFGTKIRTQFEGSFGMAVNASFTHIEAIEPKEEISVILTMGVYYSFSMGFGRWIVDCNYGWISAANISKELFMPSLEFHRPLTDRIAISLEGGWLVPNDWFKDWNFKENYGSFTLSLGTSLIF